MGEGTGASGQDAGSVLGMLRSILPGEQHTGSAPSAKLSYMKPLPITPSENLLYKDYIPGLAGRGDDPGFMSITERLSKMMGLHRQKSGQARSQRIVQPSMTCLPPAELSDTRKG